MPACKGRINDNPQPARNRTGMKGVHETSRTGASKLHPRYVSLFLYHLKKEKVSPTTRTKTLPPIRQHTTAHIAPTGVLLIFLFSSSFNPLFELRSLYFFFQTSNMFFSFFFFFFFFFFFLLLLLLLLLCSSCVF